MKKLRTIDPEMATSLRDRLYYTVRCNLVPKKGWDNFVKDEQARQLTEELVGKLDGLFIQPEMPAPSHSGEHYRSQRTNDLDERVRMAAAARPHLLPVMNERSAIRQEQE